MKDAHPVRIGVCGEFQVGKSLLINCLLGGEFALVGDLFPTTPFPVSYRWGEIPRVTALSPINENAPRSSSPQEFVAFLRKEHATPEGKTRLREFSEARVELPIPCLKAITLTDMPGFNASGMDEQKALSALECLDLAILVTRNEQLTDTAGVCWRQITRAGLPVVCVMNCCRPGAKPLPAHRDNHDLARENAAMLQNSGAFLVSSLPGSVLVLNAAWYQVAAGPVGDNGNCGDWEVAARCWFNDDLPAPSLLRELSGVEDLCRFVFPDPADSVGRNAPFWGMYYRMVKAWTDEATKLVGEMPSTINQ